MTNPVPASDPKPIGDSGRPHGKFSSWLIVAVVIAAFLTGGIAMITHAWWLFWVCVAVVALSVPAGWAMGMMDDTMAWTHAIPKRYEGKPITVEATRRQRHLEAHPDQADREGPYRR